MMKKEENIYKNGIFQPEKFAELKKLSRDQLIELGERDKDMALLIVSDPEFRDKRDDYLLFVLGQDHIEVARYILTSPELVELGGELVLSTIGAEHEEIGLAIIRDEVLVAQYDQERDLSGTIGKAHLSVAKIVLEKPEKCNQDIIELFGETYEEAAMIILKDSALVDKCYAPELCAMAKHVEAVKILSSFSKDWLIKHWGKGAICKSLGLVTPEGKPFLEQICQKVFQPEEAAPNTYTLPPSPKL